MFVTSTRQTSGSLGGLTGADALCQARAEEAGVGGTSVAWLSSTQADAIDRIAAGSGWVRRDGLPVVQSTADLTLGRIWYPPRLDEQGTDLGADAVVTATAWNGRLSPTS